MSSKCFLFLPAVLFVHMFFVYIHLQQRRCKKKDSILQRRPRYCCCFHSDLHFTAKHEFKLAIITKCDAYYFRREKLLSDTYETLFDTNTNISNDLFDNKYVRQHICLFKGPIV